MRFHRTLQSALLAGALALALPAPAQLFRAYLSSTGSDANPCTLVAPCRLLPAALNAVVGGGEVWMLDSGNYNTSYVPVTKSVSILAVPGAVASIVATPVSGGLFLYTAGVDVTLRNLVFTTTTGGNGVAMSTVGVNLRVEGCTFHDLQVGIMVRDGTTALITDSTFRDVSQDAIQVEHSVATLVRDRFLNTNQAVIVNGSGSVAFIDDSLFAFNSTALWVDDVSGSQYGPAKAFVTRSQFFANSAYGAYVHASSGIAADAMLEMSGNVLAKNWTGVRAVPGTVQSASNNRVAASDLADVEGSITPTASY